MIKKKEGYRAPGRSGIKSAVAKLIPFVPREIVESLGFTPLYSIHSEIDCYGLDPKAVAELLDQYPRLMQRPVIVKGDQAIIGRPKDRVAAFLQG